MDMPWVQYISKIQSLDNMKSKLFLPDQFTSILLEQCELIGFDCRILPCPEVLHLCKGPWHNSGGFLNRLADWKNSAQKKVPNPYLTQYTTLCLSWVDSGEHFGSSNLHALTMATWSIWNSWMFMHQRTSWNISMRCHTASPLMLQKFRCRHCQNNQSKASIFQSSNGGVEKRRPGST